jgi:hypothetical protein
MELPPCVLNRRGSGHNRLSVRGVVKLQLLLRSAVYWRTVVQSSNLLHMNHASGIQGGRLCAVLDWATKSNSPSYIVMVDATCANTGRESVRLNNCNGYNYMAALNESTQGVSEGIRGHAELRTRTTLRVVRLKFADGFHR